MKEELILRGKVKSGLILMIVMRILSEIKILQIKLFGFFFVLVIIFSFINSIKYLKHYSNKKGLAIITLIISSIFILLMIIVLLINILIMII